MRIAVWMSLAMVAAAPAAAQTIAPGYGYPGNFGGSANPSAQLSTQVDPNAGGRWVGPTRSARAMIDAGRYAEAARILSSPGVVQGKDTRFLKGVSLLALGDANAARRNFRQAARADNYREPAYLTGLAAAELKLGNQAAARGILDTLRTQQAQCDGTCTRAASLDRAVTALGRALN
ncbi:hypothetical protein [Sphingomonas sp. TZW2008]|uniref:hypothetical protein n=1 Tax=Sphingomonas sp. TZW2008 TaxID=1917973 RepID=UPI0011818A1A|nr:hypothetical protein [Sphingomonas sp. TZW2008]